MNARLTNWLAASLIALVLASAWLLDGPSEVDAIQATADAKQDAIDSVAADAQLTRARGKNNHKTIVAKVAP